MKLSGLPIASRARAVTSLWLTHVLPSPFPPWAASLKVIGLCGASSIVALLAGVMTSRLVIAVLVMPNL